MVSSGHQNQFPSSLTPLGDLLKALMFLLNLNCFNSPLLLRIKGSHKGKILPRRGRKKAESDSITLSLSPFMFLHYLFILLSCFKSVQFYALCVSLCFCLVVFQLFIYLFILSFIIKKNIEKLEKYKNSMYLCILVLMYPGWPLK